MKEKRKCERCTATDGENHPLLGFYVEVTEVDIQGDIQLLCQRCKVHRLLKSQKQTEENGKKSKSFGGMLKSIFK